MTHVLGQLVLATTRGRIADYVEALVLVYSLIIGAYILSSIYFETFQGRIPYARWSSALLAFLRDVTQPYLRIFRPLAPRVGPFDFTPLLAVLVLGIVGSVVAGLIRG